MQSKASNPEEYVGGLPPDRKEAITRLRRELLKNLPKGFKEVMSYGMIGYVVPHNLFPAGYHADSKLPLPFINLASQKNYISFYHMGLYNGPLLDWFQKEWSSYTAGKLDMGKCCVRFKKPDDIPFSLIGKLAAKMTPQEWMKIYSSKIDTRS